MRSTDKPNRTKLLAKIVARLPFSRSFSFSFFSFSFLVFPARREARSMRGVLGVEVTDEAVWSTDLEIFETGAKIPAGQK